MADILKRVGGIVSASLNDVLDRAEDPERMLRQVVRDIEESITAAKAKVVDAVTTEKLLHRQLTHHQEQSSEWLAKAESALASADETTARAALARKAEHASSIDALQSQWDTASSSCTTLKAQLTTLENKLGEAKRQQAGLVARHKAAQARSKIEEAAVELTSTLSHEATLARVEEKVLGLEARAEALAEVGGGTASLAAQAEAASNKSAAADIDAELAALKRKLAAESN